MRPKLLWVTGEVPDRHLGGAHIRKSHLIEEASAAFEIHLVTLGEVTDPVVRSAVDHLTELAEPPPPAPTGRWPARRRQLGWLVGSRGPREVAFGAPVRDALAPTVERLRPWADIVHVEHSHLADLRPAAPHEPWAITLHHLYSEVAAHAGAVADSRWQRWLWAREEAKARRHELWMQRTFDVVMTMSDDDDEAFGGGTFVVPNGVDGQRFAVTPLPVEPTLVFTAHLAYRPNVDAAVWFCEAVLPLVQRAVPEATLDLVGRAPTADVHALAERPGVAVHADVPDVLPYLHSARVAVVPVRIGSGTRLKALEAMAAGRPVVGTSIGLSGLGIVDGVHASVADAPSALAAAVTELLVDDERAARQVGASRRLVEERFLWSSVGARFVAALLSRSGAVGAKPQAP